MNSVEESFIIVVPSAEMIKEAGASWVILGHSERRTIFHEDDEVNLFLITHVILFT